MFQIVAGRQIYVVKFDTMPKLPITSRTEEEKPYALALDTAIREGQITEPGKYGIQVTQENGQDIYNLFHIIEE
jgi:hypothetical protein